MNIDAIIDKLSYETREESQIIKSRSLDFSVYASKSNIVDHEKLTSGKQMIEIRPHTRFVHFPKHKHNYVEMVYGLRGTTHHYVNGEAVELNKGGLLIMNEHVLHEVQKSGLDDLAINFIIRPLFFDTTLKMMHAEQNSIKSFLIACLTGDDTENTSYLYYDAKDYMPVRHLIENMIHQLFLESYDIDVLKYTMGLMFMELARRPEFLMNKNESMILKILKSIDHDYKTISLSKLSEEFNYDVSTISKMIKSFTGKGFNELLIQRRLQEVCYLLEHSPLTFDAIVDLVGYSNKSYCYKMFKKTYGLTPKNYRIQKRT
ncbi:helix-turn-helix domain-containing protein [Acidaminobacter sp. JC074]|uniref:AraC family transcriptional regulator n=1 Tax=Acidaminobacter sp. JC074 TaxID=2530199 RepID=UPI001F0E5849|nr:AraC family transcriptional regulator [Acidaminobacter sp. JC074]MCH4887039.1 helix-turn-helix domain-containing protein [Acidaminobacter sp. JC074]